MNNRNLRYWLRLVAFFLATLAVALLGLPYGLGFVSAYGITKTPCRPGTDPAAHAMAFEDVSFPSTDGLTLRGYFIPAESTGTVIVAPTLSASRGTHMDYVRIYNNAGLSVFAFESRACAGYGSVTFGAAEAEDIAAAYAYLSARNDVSAVSTHGFSAAGGASLLAMPEVPGLAAVSAMGNYADFPATVGLGRSETYIGWLYSNGFAAGYGVGSGEDIDDLTPINTIDQIAPRPILLLYGSRETTLGGARAMQAAAGDNAQLVVIEGAAHGEYLAVAPTETAAALTEFHIDAIAPELRTP